MKKLSFWTGEYTCPSGVPASSSFPQVFHSTLSPVAKRNSHFRTSSISPEVCSRPYKHEFPARPHRDRDSLGHHSRRNRLRSFTRRRLRQLFGRERSSWQWPACDVFTAFAKLDER